MQHILFIADLHLDEKHPATTSLFYHFLEKHAVHAEAVYILGDFFELWIGDDDSNLFINKIKTQLKQLTKRKIPVYFLHGNRDFLVGKTFAEETGCKIIPEHSIIEAYGSQVLLLHGDSLCINDISHMKFRKLTQNNFLKSIFLLLPLHFRKKIGHRLRKNSRKHHSSISSATLSIQQQTVSSVLKHHGINKMIHGHIHQPEVCNFYIENQPAERIVLGSWERQGCVLKWYANGKREMLFFNTT